MSAPPAPLSKLEQADLAVVRQRAELAGPSHELIARCTGATEAIGTLQSAGQLVDAARLMAHAMPRREAVWWACMCARHTRPADLAPGHVAALEAAELWVRKPTDEHRRAAFAAAQDAGFGTPEAWSCVGAFWSGDSMAPLGQPLVPPAPNLTGAAIAGSVALAAVRDQPEHQMRRLGVFLASAWEIAAGGPGRIDPEAEA